MPTIVASLLGTCPIGLAGCSSAQVPTKWKFLSRGHRVGATRLRFDVEDPITDRSLTIICLHMPVLCLIPRRYPRMPTWFQKCSCHVLSQPRAVTIL